jgi:hypothetical protein
LPHLRQSGWSIFHTQELPRRGCILSLAKKQAFARARLCAFPRSTRIIQGLDRRDAVCNLISINQRRVHRFFVIPRPSSVRERIGSPATLQSSILAIEAFTQPCETLHGIACDHACRNCRSKRLGGSDAILLTYRWSTYGTKTSRQLAIKKAHLISR